MAEPVPCFVVIDAQEGLDAAALEAKLGMPVVVIQPGTRCYLQASREVGMEPKEDRDWDDTHAVLVVDTSSGVDVKTLEARTGWPVVQVRPGTRVEVYALPPPRKA